MRDVRDGVGRFACGREELVDKPRRGIRLRVRSEMIHIRIKYGGDGLFGP